MEEKRNRIYQLMTEKLAGVINAPDEDYLDQLIDSDSMIREKWNEMQGVVSDSAFKGRSRHFIPPWQREKRSVKTIPWSGLAAACLAALIILSAGYYFRKYTTKESPLVISADSPSDHISLTLSSGAEINLSDATGNIHSGEMVLQNENKTLSFSTSDLESSVTNESKINTLSVPVGIDFKINFVDGTTVWLNSATEIKFPFRFSENVREVEIDGEAYLKVVEDPGRPFIVRLPESDVEVVGTAFNINSYETGSDRIALVEGSVKVNTNGATTEIRPGTQLTYTRGKGISESTFDPREVLGWQRGIFYFYDANLPEICRVLPRWFGIDVVLDNPSIESKRFAGILDKNQPIDVFLEDLRTITHIEYYFEKDGKELHFRIPE